MHYIKQKKVEMLSTISSYLNRFHITYIFPLIGLTNQIRGFFWQFYKIIIYPCVVQV